MRYVPAWPLARTQAAFTFSAPQKTLTELAIITVSGGIKGKSQGDDIKLQHRVAAIDANREELARSVLTQLGVPAEKWGEAVNSRPLILVGEKDPWEATIATVRDPAVLTPLFGADGKMTVALSVSLSKMLDSKTQSYDDDTLEIEIGAVGDGTYAHFRSIGHKGHIVAAPNSQNGYVLSFIMDQNERHYPYSEEQWQAGAAFYAGSHIKASLVAGLDEATAGTVVLDHIATRQLVPLNTLLKKQSVKGLETHLLVKGVAFNEGDDGVPAPPVSLRANLLDGGLSENGLTPTTSVMGYRLKLVGSSHLCRVHNGLWYAPLAARAKEAADAAAKAAPGAAAPSGVTAHSWGKASTARRRQNRAIVGAQQKAAATAARRHQMSDGEVSDDSTAELRSAIARARVANSAAAGGAGVTWADADNLC